MNKAEGAGKVLLSLLNDILDFSKAEAGKIVLERAPFNVHEVLRDLAVMMGTMAAGKNLEVIFDPSPDIPLVLIGDPLRLHQVLLNLGATPSSLPNRERWS